MEFVIVTPSYNQKKFLQKTISSIADQKKVTVHHWVFDGGSNDGSKELLEKKGKNLFFVSEKDKGQSDALNKGVKKLFTWMKKEKKNPKEIIFAYLNSDDYYLPGALSYVADTFEKRHNVRWVIGDCVIVDENNKEIHQIIRWYKKFWRNFFSLTLLSILNPIPQPAVFFRASEITKIGLFNEKLRYAMDFQYWFRTLKKSGKPFITAQPLAAFRIHSLSKGGSQFEKQFAEQYAVTKMYIDNTLSLVLQRCHNLLITGIYSLIK